MTSKMKQGIIVFVVLHVVSFSSPAAIPDQPLDPNHVPSSACENMFPVHNDSRPSANPAPYSITPSKRSVSPGEIIEVVVSGKSGAVYKGLYMQVRNAEGGSEALGTFPLSNLDVDSAVRISTCPPGRENALSYVSRTAVETLTLEWKAPEYSGSVYFRGTILESFSVFWVGVESDTITIE